MSTIPQRAAYQTALVETIHRNLRFLEAVVNSPIGLTTDLKSLREALPLAGAMEERDRQAFTDLTGAGRNPRRQGLAARRLTDDLIVLLGELAPEGESRLPAPWLGRARKVLDRIAERLGADLRRDTAQSMAGVYVIVDPEHTNGRSVTQVAEAAVKGGASAIQLRAKKGDKGRVLESARKIGAICASGGAVFIVNDHADVARLSEADGLHVGQGDLPISEARRILADHQIVGKSNALLQEALQSEADTADYVAVGSIFQTSTKTNTRPAGLETLQQVKRSVGAPVVAIGGINHTNVAKVAKAGADVVCVASAVTLAEDPEHATSSLRELFEGARPK